MLKKLNQLIETYSDVTVEDLKFQSMATVEEIIEDFKQLGIKLNIPELESYTGYCKYACKLTIINLEEFKGINVSISVLENATWIDIELLEQDEVEGYEEDNYSNYKEEVA